MNVLARPGPLPASRITSIDRRTCTWDARRKTTRPEHQARVAWEETVGSRVVEQLAPRREGISGQLFRTLEMSVTMVRTFFSVSSPL